MAGFNLNVNHAIVIKIVKKNNMFTNKQTNNDCGWIKFKFY